MVLWIYSILCEHGGRGERICCFRQDPPSTSHGSILFSSHFSRRAVFLGLLAPKRSRPNGARRLEELASFESCRWIKNSCQSRQLEKAISYYSGIRYLVAIHLARYASALKQLNEASDSVSGNWSGFVSCLLQASSLNNYESSQTDEMHYDTCNLMIYNDVSRANVDQDIK